MIDHTSLLELKMEENGSLPSSAFCHDSRPKMATTAEEELVELLWQDGQVVMQNQTPRSSKNTLLPSPMFHFGDAGSFTQQQVLPQKLAGDGDVGQSASAATTNELYMQEDEMASWLQCPIDDAEFYSDLLSPQPNPSASATAAKPPPVPPPRRAPEAEPVANFAMFSRVKGKAARSERVVECTVVDSSITPPVAAAARVAAAGSERNGGSACDTTLTSSSGGSAASAGDRKRKERKVDEFEGLSEDAEFDYVEEKKPARGSSSAKRTRAAEVHNLSERRRRDRINEKMKALQELIPHCNKSDKASMLDEAIDYLKSLQTTVQMMTRGCGMAPMVFPGVQHYMPQMGMGMGMGMNVAGMNMDISTSSLNRPLLPFPTVLSPSPAAQGAAAHMAQRLLIPQYSVQHIPILNQPMSASVQADPAFHMLGLQVPSPQPPINVVDPYQQYLALHHISLPQQQGQAIAPSKNSYCNGTDAHFSKKPG